MPVQTKDGPLPGARLYLASDHNGLLLKAMEGLAARIVAARERVQDLLRERKDHLATIAKLGSDAREWNREADVLKARIIELEQENEVLRAEKSTPEVEQRAGSKEKIDELVNEIDRCLALLNT